jgi:signal recognition particle subunit SRP54
MTPSERRNPKVLDARRKRRIAAGSGTKVEDVNRLVKMHRQMADMMKAVGRNKGMLNRLVGGGGRGSAPSEAEMAAMQEELAKLDPKALEQLAPDLKDALQQGATKGGFPQGLPKGLPGLGGGMPKFPGLGGGLPGLGGGLPRFPGLPGKKK